MKPITPGEQDAIRAAARLGWRFGGQKKVGIGSTCFLWWGEWPNIKQHKVARRYLRAMLLRLVAKRQKAPNEDTRRQIDSERARLQNRDFLLRS